MLRPVLKLNDIDFSSMVSKAKETLNGSMLKDILTPLNCGGNGVRVTEPLMLALSQSLPDRLIVVEKRFVSAPSGGLVNEKLVPRTMDCTLVPYRFMSANLIPLTPMRAK
jgi:hypothetical protein